MARERQQDGSLVNGCRHPCCWADADAAGAAEAGCGGCALPPARPLGPACTAAAGSTSAAAAAAGFAAAGAAFAAAASTTTAATTFAAAAVAVAPASSPGTRPSCSSSNAAAAAAFLAAVAAGDAVGNRARPAPPIKTHIRHCISSKTPRLVRERV